MNGMEEFRDFRVNPFLKLRCDFPLTATPPYGGRTLHLGSVTSACGERLMKKLQFLELVMKEPLPSIRLCLISAFPTKEERVALGPV